MKRRKETLFQEANYFALEHGVVIEQADYIVLNGEPINFEYFMEVSQSPLPLIGIFPKLKIVFGRYELERLGFWDYSFMAVDDFDDEGE